MNAKPIWQLVQDCARELNKNGNVPFTRRDLIACVQKKKQGCEENSINPVIQGLTNNLKGGAPVADGKNVLHSVGRGLFVLYSKRDQIVSQGIGSAKEKTNKVEVTGGVVTEEHFPNTENELRDHILGVLKERLSSKPGLKFVAEGRLPYKLPDGSTIHHASDILITTETGKLISIELKYKSAVTDQFKCRAYDAMHMKKEYRDGIVGIMLFVKSKSGVSIEQARRLSYPFDLFIGLKESEIGNPGFVDQLVSAVSKQL